MLDRLSLYYSHQGRARRHSVVACPYNVTRHRDNLTYLLHMFTTQFRRLQRRRSLIFQTTFVNAMVALSRNLKIRQLLWKRQLSSLFRRVLKIKATTILETSIIGNVDANDYCNEINKLVGIERR